MVDNIKIAIMGAGHAGFAHAADLSLKGFEVRLYEVPEMAETIKEAQALGGIEAKPEASTGLKSGFAKVSLITTSAADAIDGADVIFVVTPAFAQTVIAKYIAPHVTSEQIVVLSPGNFGGAVTFAKTMKEAGCTTSPVLCEAQSMIYACRKDSGTSVRIFGYKQGMKMAVFPAKKTAEVIPTLQKVFPTIEAAPNVLYTWLNNPNAIIHPTATILNAGWIDSTGGDFLFYVQGMSPAVVRVIEALDCELKALGEALDLDLIPYSQLAMTWYGHQGYEHFTLSDSAKNPVYHAIKAYSELDNRYITEDVPFGLVPLEDVARLVGIDMPICSSLITLANNLLGQDFRATGQTLKSVGLGDLSVDELKQFVEQG